MSAKAVDLGSLSFRLDARIDHLLLDEFQDTSPQQWRVIQPWAERVTAGADGTSFFCVGDVKQAIYGWRGGIAEIFDAIDRQLPGLTPQSLNTSFRSSPPVIDAVNHIFTHLAEHPNLGRAEPAVKRWSQRFRTAYDAAAGVNRLRGIGHGAGGGRRRVAAGSHSAFRRGADCGIGRAGPRPQRRRADAQERRRGASDLRTAQAGTCPPARKAAIR